MKPIKLTKQALATITAVASMRLDYTALIWGDDTLTVAMRDEAIHAWGVVRMDGASSDMQHLAVPSAILADTIASLSASNDITLSVMPTTLRLEIKELAPDTGILVSEAKINCMDWRGMRLDPIPVQAKKELARIETGWLAGAISDAQGIIGSYRLEGGDMMPEVTLAPGEVRVYGFTSASGIRRTAAAKCENDASFPISSAREAAAMLSKSDADEVAVVVLEDGRMAIAYGDSVVAFPNGTIRDEMIKMLDARLDENRFGGVRVAASQFATAVQQAAKMSRSSASDHGRVTLRPRDNSIEVLALEDGGETLFLSDVPMERDGEVISGDVSFGGDVIATISSAAKGMTADIFLGGSHSPIVLSSDDMIAIAMPRLTPVARKG